MKAFSIINIGTDIFLPAFAKSHTPFTHVDWKPPAQGDAALVDMVFHLSVGFRDQSGQSVIDRANSEALRRILAAQPVLKRIRPAHECLPGFGKNTILHAGPPIAWEAMCDPMRGAVLGALLYEGLARTLDEAATLMDKGLIEYGPTSPHHVVAPMAGVVSCSMPLVLVENETFGVTSFAPLNEGVGQALRFGSNSPAILERLSWFEKHLAPALDAVLLKLGGVNLKNIMGQALAMGDEMHQRNIAASLLFFRAVACELVGLDLPDGEKAQIVEFLSRKNSQFFLNLAMAAAKSALIPAQGIAHSSLITTMSRNGVDFGIQLGALNGRWFTFASRTPEALYFPGFDQDDANPDLGDSSIVECYGIGGFAMGAAPAVSPFAGAFDIAQALRYTQSMGYICVGHNPDLPLPNLNYMGVPTGIDVRQVVATGILPVINSGVAHKLSGIGQVGTGHAHPPMQVMHAALKALYESLCAEFGA